MLVSIIIVRRPSRCAGRKFKMQWSGPVAIGHQCTLLCCAY